ncbi:hypothetical protein GGR51DRAFT_574936 [Nemania sp. FL0031]|nr:hypothetical protein GGR51DRAFT_574936 [Nemania sp. FL0031]
MEFSTPTYSQLPWALPEEPPKSPKSDRCTPTKRDFESAFPDTSPDQALKRLRSNSDSQIYHKTHDGNVSNNDTTASDPVSTSYETAKALPEPDPADIKGTPTAEISTGEPDSFANPNFLESLRNYSRDEIRNHIANIKKYSGRDEIDLSTAEMLVDEIMALTATDSAMRDGVSGVRWRISSGLDGMLISPAGAKPNKTPTVSPLSERFSPTAAPRFIDVATSPLASAEFENMATQTEPATTSRDSSILGAKHRSVSDGELWERELELIRRPQPLFRGYCTTVNVPLRKTVARLVSTSYGATADSTKSGYLPNLKSEPTLRYNNLPFISLSDTDDETQGRCAPSSSLVGGGGILYGADGSQFVPSDEEEEDGALFTTHQGSRHQRHLSSNDGSAGDLPDYEYYAIDDNPDPNGATKHTNTSMVSAGDHYHFGVNSPYNYQNEESEASLFVHDDVIGISRSKNRGTKDESQLSSSTRVHHFDGEHNQDGSAWLPGRTQYNRRYMREEQEDSSFYGCGTSADPASHTRKLLRYQDRLTDVGEIPGPRPGLRLKLDDYVHDTGINKEMAGSEQGIKRIIDETFFAGETIDQEQAWRHGWVNDLPKLYKGFPLVENIEFVSLGNHDKPDGDCYWRALAYNLHGTSTRWDIIKAEHLAYLQHVLTDKTHPRHDLYTKLNTQFFESNGPTPGLKFKANLWQLLHMPHSWTPGVIQQITADLYSIHLVTFTYESRKRFCSEVSIRGAYNSRHVFMLFIDGVHFQPLTVNEYLS